MTAQKLPPIRPTNKRHQWWRYSRYFHAWFSAFACVMLLFFAVTGILLNHPQWFDDDTHDEHTVLLTIPDTLAAQLVDQEDPSRELIAYVRSELGLLGRFKGSDVIDDEVDIQLTGPYGSTDITANLTQKTIEVLTNKSNAITVLGELHRGKDVAPAWRWTIDISAGIIIILSVIGIVLFFAQRGRVLQHVWIMVASLVVLAVLLLLGVQ